MAGNRVTNTDNTPPSTIHNPTITTSSSSSTYDHSAPLATTEHLHKQPSETATPTTSAKNTEDVAKPATQETPEDVPDSEGESPLDNADFLSFEEWKKRNLAKAGQSPDNLGGARSEPGEPRRRPGGINNALDSLGEDTEIEIDFAGFVNPQVTAPGMPDTEQRAPAGSGDRSGITDNKDPGTRLSSAHPKSKDAGVTCKERSNYASFDCAATILKTNPECKSATSVLVENKDSYMLNECSASNKFFIVELCNDILVDTVVLANFEFFSSIFRTFRVSVSDRYPVKLDKWRELGTFEAKNSRGIQAFLVEEPQIWARYLRVEFLTHYGHEYYCPVSLLRIHGTTMMEEFNHELKNSKGEEDLEGEAEDEEVPQEAHSVRDVITAEVLKRESKVTVQESTPTEPPGTDSSTIPNPSDEDTSNQLKPVDYPNSLSSTDTTTVFNNSPSVRLEAVFAWAGKQGQVCRQSEAPAGRPLSSSASPIPVNASTFESSLSSAITSTGDDTTPSPTSSASVSSHNPTVSSDSGLPSAAHSKVENTTSISSRTPNQASQPPSKLHTSSTQPSAPNPTTQESFFKSVHKRLQLLEANSTLSLQYIEEQSRILRDAFAKVEKRQLAKTTTFLETLNSTVLNEVREFRTQYDQIWQSTILELSSQRQQSQIEIAALSSRLTLLADELLFQKRIAILQFLFILLCLGLALFSRGSAAAAGVTYLEYVVNKSSINLSRYASGLESSAGSPSSTRPPSRYGFFSRVRSSDHRRSPSEESMGGPGGERDGMKSPSMIFEPATPTSLRSEEDSAHGSPRSDSHKSPSRDRSVSANGLLSPDDRLESSSSSGSTASDDGGHAGS
ncbi:MAG: hypothetical protein Q9166_001211 [cf. Caloplaca sp. 2 TL-2023]